MRFLALLFLSLVVATTAFAKSSAVGFRTLPVPGITTVVWYPTNRSGPVTTVAGNQVFVGVPVVTNAAISGSNHPVALLSHGYSGLWRNQAWLAERLARAGYIAVALNHPGTTFGDLDPAWAKHLAERPHQVSRVLDALFADPDFGPRIDRKRISVIGHSLGGSTALFLAGGVFDPPRLIKACGNDTRKMLCNVYRKGGLTADMAPISACDPRISAVILLDLEGRPRPGGCFSPILRSRRSLNRPCRGNVIRHGSTGSRRRGCYDAGRTHGPLRQMHGRTRARGSNGHAVERGHL